MLPSCVSIVPRTRPFDFIGPGISQTNHVQHLFLVLEIPCRRDRVRMADDQSIGFDILEVGPVTSRIDRTRHKTRVLQTVDEKVEERCAFLDRFV